MTDSKKKEPDKICIWCKGRMGKFGYTVVKERDSGPLGDGNTYEDVRCRCCQGSGISPTYEMNSKKKKERMPVDFPGICGERIHKDIGCGRVAKTARNKKDFLK